MSCNFHKARDSFACPTAKITCIETCFRSLFTERIGSSEHFMIFFVETASEVAFLEASNIFIQSCTSTAPMKPTKRTIFERRRVSPLRCGIMLRTTGCWYTRERLNGPFSNLPQSFSTMSLCPWIMKWPQEICWGKPCERLQAFVLVAGALRGWSVDMIHCNKHSFGLACG